MYLKFFKFINEKRSVFIYKLSRRMGNTRNSYLWYYAICATRYTNSMYGISCFNGIFYSSRRGNYQTSSIPSRLAPMSFLIWETKRGLCLRAIWILSNNSMALRIRYEIFFFKKLTLYIERVVWDKGQFDLIYWEIHFSVTNFFVLSS